MHTKHHIYSITFLLLNLVLLLIKLIYNNSSIERFNEHYNHHLLNYKIIYIILNAQLTLNFTLSLNIINTHISEESIIPGRKYTPQQTLQKH